MANFLKNILSSGLTWFWWHLPLKRRQKESIKSRLFTWVPYVFRNTRVYKNWHDAVALNKENQFPENIGVTDSMLIYSESNNRFDSAQKQPEAFGKVESLAIVIHVHYIDMLSEITTFFKKWKKNNFQIYITTTLANLNTLSLDNNEINPFVKKVLVVENHGRDILPFLKIIPEVIEDEHGAILKLHTKKSDHRKSGALWRRDVFKKLLSEKSMLKAVDIFNSNKSVGMIGPSGHIVPMSLYYGANAGKINHLSQRMNVNPKIINSLSFVAGSMFYVRRDALLPLIRLNLTEDNFEPEAGQQDGTMAHAIERAFAISTYAAGLKLADTAYSTSKPSPLITQDHPFTW